MAQSLPLQGSPLPPTISTSAGTCTLQRLVMSFRLTVVSTWDTTAASSPESLRFTWRTVEPATTVQFQRTVLGTTCTCAVSTMTVYHARWSSPTVCLLRWELILLSARLLRRSVVVLLDRL